VLFVSIGDEWRPFLVGVQDKDIQPAVADDSFEQIGSTLKQARRAQGLKISDVSQQPPHLG
jgi:hypothetical protein